MKLGNPLRSILAAAIMAAGLVFGASGGAQAQWLDFPDITKTGEILSNALRIPGLDGVGGIADGGFRDSGRVNVEPVGLNQERAAPGHGEPIPNGQEFQITIDGQPIDGNGNPTQLLVGTPEDDQRTVDVALDQMDINLSYDGLELKRVVNIETQARSLEAGVRWRPVVFTPYWNYGAWIRKAEVRIFPVYSGVAKHRSGASTQKKPLEVLPITGGKRVDWIPSRAFAERYPEVQFVLRMYGRDGRFDETRPKRLKLTRGQLGRFDNDVSAFDVETLIGYDKNSLEIENIEVSGGAVTVSGRNVPEGVHIFVMGREVPVSRGREFVLREIVPAGSHNVTIAALDKDGKGIEFQRNLYVPDNDFFYIGLGDLTVGTTDVSGPASTVLDAEGEYDDVYIDGRLAFFLKGKVQGKYLITAMADTGEDSIGDLFSNLDEKDPRQLLRRLDPDRYYPVYGDDSTTEELAPTQGKFFVRIERGNSYAMWGNYQTEVNQTDFAQINRGLYGLKAHYGSPTQTSFGEQRIQVDAFAAEPGTAHQREEFRGTGGSVYFLQKQDLSIGSERMRIEVRDANSNIVLNARSLVYGDDYDIDYIQGRIILSQPLTSTVDDGFLVQDGTLSGNPAYLVAYYEYTPLVTDLDDGLFYGGRAQAWIGDFVKIGASSMVDQSGTVNRELLGADITLRMNAGTYIKAEFAQTSGPGYGEVGSGDGGFTSGAINNGSGTGAIAPFSTDAVGYRIEAAADLAELGVSQIGGVLTAYYQHRDAGFAAPGQYTANEIDQFGVSATVQVADGIEVRGAFDHTSDVTSNSDRTDANLDVVWKVSDAWSVGGGVGYVENSSGDRMDVGGEVRYHVKTSRFMPLVS